jgi:Lipase (class 3)
MNPSMDTQPTPDAVLMTLAGIAYGDPAEIAGYIAEATPTAADWEVAWLPDPPSPPVNFAFMARNRRSGDSVLAIRGTYPNPFCAAYWADGQQDSPFGTMVDWPGAPGARISAGTAQGLAGLLALKDTDGCSLLEAVRRMSEPGHPTAGTASSTAPPLTVTGHSLGGTLAPVLALQLSQAIPGLAVSSVSFAGMTPGNQAFAALLGPGTPFEGRVRRVFNTLDSVAYGWDQVWATHDFYQPHPQGGMVVAALLMATAARLALGNYGYAAVGEAVPLEGQVRPVSIPCELIAYVFENLHQHLPDTYLALLGAPPLPFSLLFGSVVVPRDHPAALVGPRPDCPVVYAT